MQVHEETERIRMQEWRRIIEDRAVSGLTIRAYCEEHNLSKNAYYYWLRKLRERVLKEQRFAEISIPEVREVMVKETFTPVRINIGKCNMVIEDKETLRTVVEVLLHAQ